VKFELSCDLRARQFARFEQFELWCAVSPRQSGECELAKDLVREETITKDWKLAIAAAKEMSTTVIDTTFVGSAGMGLDFRRTGNGKCSVFSIDDGSLAMKLSNNELKIGALLVSVNDDSSYNPDRIAILCRERPLKLTFCPPLESTQGEVLPDTNESTINGIKEIRWSNGPIAWKPIHNRLGRLYSHDMQRIADAQKATSSHVHGCMYTR
jgi:hypothetical protein